MRECFEFAGPRCLVQYAASVLDVDVTHVRACSQGHLACLINTIRALMVRIGWLGAFTIKIATVVVQAPYIE